MASDISGDSLFKASPQVVSCELDDGAALLDLEKNVYYGLNPVAAEIWAAVQEPVSVTALSDVVQSKFDTGGANVAGDVVALLLDMEKAGLVDRADAPAA